MTEGLGVEVVVDTIRKLVNQRGAHLVSVDYCTRFVLGKGEFFSSDVWEVLIKITHPEHGQDERIHFLAKFINQSSMSSRLFDMEQLYANELLFYDHYAKKVLGPAANEFLPKFFYGEANRSASDCIVLEYLINYRLCAERVFLPNDHVVLALRYLGKFHGLSYCAKQKDSKGYEEVCSRFPTAYFQEFPKDPQMLQSFFEYFGAAMIGILKYLPNSKAYSEDVLEKYKKLFKVSRYIWFCPVVSAGSDRIFLGRDRTFQSPASILGV